MEAMSSRVIPFYIICMIKYFIYCRKSSEDVGRQILSIDSQMAELQKMAKGLDLPIAQVFTEAKSAKAPGRPVFDLMIQRIEKGEAEGLICWKLDRLTRNPMDSGKINWLLQNGVIKHIQTIDRSFYPNDNVLPMDVEFSMANQYIRDLSINVRRGLKRKVDKGWYPSKAPLGYVNNKHKEKGERDVQKDKERFSLVRKMWDLMLTGAYTPPQILDMANDDWGFRTRKTKRSGNKPLSRSGIYKIFKNPFYFGCFEYNGQLYKGNHEPMITVEEYDKVQMILGKNGNPREKKYRFAYTGMIKCGECGCSITAEHVKKTNKGNGFIHRYIYYRCTKKKKNIKCSQSSVELKQLENQIAKLLFQIRIPEKLKDWVLKHLDELGNQELINYSAIRESIEKTLKHNQKELSNLINLRLRDLLSDDEFLAEKNRLQKVKAELEGKLKNQGEIESQCLELSKQTFIFACYASFWFRNDSLEDRKAILMILGSNLFLRDKKLIISLRKQFLIIENALKGIDKQNERIQPLKMPYFNFIFSDFATQESYWCRLVDDVRTYWREAVKAGNDWVSFKYQMKELLKQEKAGSLQV